MHKGRTLTTLGAVLGLAVLGLMSAQLKAGDSSRGSIPVTVTVSVRSKAGSATPALAREDVLVYQQGSRRPVLNWTPAGAHSGLDLAIVVDDSLESQFGLQLGDLKSFIRALSPSTRVAIVYAQHGDATFVQEFTGDHEQAMKALRLPQGRVEAGSSIYLALADLVRHWPDSHNRRSVLLISDGLDLYRGVVDSTPGLNPDLQHTIEAAQRAGVTVYTLFTNSVGRADRNSYLNSNGQGSLEMLASATGGDAFFQGTQTPLAFQPFLSQLRNELDAQYMLTFAAQTRKQPGYQPLRITTEQPGVKLIGPQQVYVPGS